MISAISGITYAPPVSYNPSPDYMQFYNQAIAAGYGSEEAKKIAKEKVKEKRNQKAKDRKIEDPNKANNPKQSIDRRA